MLQLGRHLVAGTLPQLNQPVADGTQQRPVRRPEAGMPQQLSLHLEQRPVAGTLQQLPLQPEDGLLPLPVPTQTSPTHHQDIMLRLSLDDQEDTGGDDNSDKSRDLVASFLECSRILAGGTERDTDVDLTKQRLSWLLRSLNVELRISAHKSAALRESPCYLYI